MGIGRYDGEFINPSIHVLFQALLIYGLITISQRWLLIRIMVAVYIVTVLFVELTYGGPLSIGIIMSVLNSSPSESFSFVQFNAFYFLLSCLFLYGMIFFNFPTRMRVNLAFVSIGMCYVVIPTLVSSQALASSPNYPDHVKTGLAKYLNK